MKPEIVKPEIVKIETMQTDMTRRQMLQTAGLTTAMAALTILAFAQDSSPTIGIALVGGAHIHTPQYISALKNRKSVIVKGVWDHDAPRAEKCARALGCKTVADVKEIWADPTITAVVICSETNRHHDLVMAAAHAKKHMFVEKPLGITAKESFAMADTIEKANLLFTTGYFMRGAREHLFLKDQIAKGSFGKITRVRGSNAHNAALGGWFDGEYRWMADPKIAGIGGFGDLGTHSFDLLMWMLGGIDMVTADITSITNRYPGCDEYGESLIKFQSGVIGTVAAGWVDVDNPVPLLISGTEGRATIVDGLLYFKSSKVPKADGQEAWSDLPKALPPPIAQFFDALEGKPHDNLVKPHEAALRVAAIEAAYKSAHTQAWVKVAQG